MRHALGVVMPAIARALVVAVIVALAQSISARHAAARPAVEFRVPDEERPAARLGEMVGWLAREQFEDGGFTWQNRIGFSAGKVQYRSRNPTPPEVVDTAMVGLSLLRFQGASRTWKARKVLAGATSFVEGVVLASDWWALDLSSQKSPLMVRIGPHVDTFFALWLLAEVRDPGTPTNPDPLVTKLIAKVESNIAEDGSWGDPKASALNAPLLGHAVGVRALETARRRGFKVDPAVFAKAVGYALSEEARKRDELQAGKWKPGCGGFRPRWMRNVALDDFEPINEAFYLSAARLCVLDQAERSKAGEEQRLRARLEEPANDDVLEEIAASLKAIVETRQTLAVARDQMSAAHAETKSFAPLIFDAEDFLAALLTVDAMGTSEVEEWFPPTVRALVRFQDADGGLKIQDHVSCWVRGPGKPCPCEVEMGTGIPRELCPLQLSFCSRDRVMCTAAGLALLLADTPYRKGFLNPKSVK